MPVDAEAVRRVMSPAEGERPEHAFTHAQKQRALCWLQAALACLGHADIRLEHLKSLCDRATDELGEDVQRIPVGDCLGVRDGRRMLLNAIEIVMNLPEAV